MAAQSPLVAGSQGRQMSVGSTTLVDRAGRISSATAYQIKTVGKTFSPHCHQML